MSTPSTLIRKLRNRIPDIDALDIRPIAPFVFKVTFSCKGVASFDEVAKEVEEVLDAEKSAGTIFRLEPFSLDTALPNQSVSPYLALAGLASDQTRDGLPRTLVSVVHDLAKVFIEEEPGRIVTFRVAREDGSAPDELLDRVRTALEVVGYAGIPFDVKPVDPKNPLHADMRRAGFSVPSRHPRLVDYTEDDEVRYAQRIRRLVDGQSDDVSSVDNPSAARIYLTTGLEKLDIGALLPLYERIYVELPMKRDATTYFEEAYGLDRKTFVELCRAGVVLPIFRGNLGHYPEVIWREWLEDPSLALISPRDADFVAMRHIWKTSPFVRQFRGNTQQLKALDDAMRRILNAGGPEFRKNKWLYDILSWVRHGAEEFEGIAFHRGTIALGNLSAGGALAHLLSAKAAEIVNDKAVADTLSIEGFIASQHIALAQAFNASLFDNLILNTIVLKTLVPMFQEAIEVNGRLETRRIVELVKALELHHSPRIPVDEYLSIMNAHETTRIRSLVQNLLSGIDRRSADRELRERVTNLNKEVASVDKMDLRISTVDVLGDVSSAAGALTSGGAYGMVLLSKLLGGAVAGKLITRGVDSLLDGKAGSTIDNVRGALNGVSPQAIRLFRLRRKLKK